ncbi:hypothetical protein FB380_004493 [Modestobacter marinus]|uniref:Uncharacterized protein n=1 Tax=Modestobacter marinus TaxID=477641 RepID=A0A846LW92_9ACTN|nr:hypothetical protein [Modestobacter marinus]
MRHLEHVGGQVETGRHQARLRLGAEVAGEQHPEAALRGPHDEAEVVGLGTGDGLGRVGGQHLEVRAADRPPVTGQEDHVVRTRLGHGPVQLRHPLVVGRQRPGGHHPDVPPGQGTGEPTHVVGVQVREQHQRQPLHPQSAQAAVDEGRVRARVDQHPLTRAGRQHERIALADVAGHHDRVRQWPAPAELAQRPADQHDAQQGGERQQAQPGPAPQRPDGAAQDDGQQDRTGDAGRPAGGAVGHGRGTLGDGDQPAHRPPGEPGERVGRPRRSG